MAVEVGALRVALSADTAQFQRDLAAAQGMAQRFGASIVSGLAGRLTDLAAGFLSVSGAVQLFNDGVDKISKIDALSQQLNLTTRETQALAQVAGEAGVSIDQLSKVATEFGSRLQSGLRAPMSDVSQIMRSLGVDARNADGSIRSFADLLPQLAAAFGRFADDENKTIAATRLFGQAIGPEMAVFLTQFGRMTDEQRQKLEQQQQAMDVEGVRRYQSEMARLQKAFADLGVTVANVSAGPLATFLEQLQRIFSVVLQAPSLAKINLQLLSPELHRDLDTALRQLDEVKDRLQRLREFQTQSAGGVSEQWHRDLQAALDDLARAAPAAEMAAAKIDLLRLAIAQLMQGGSIAGLVAEMQQLRVDIEAEMKAAEAVAAAIDKARGAAAPAAPERPSIALPDPRALAEAQAQLQAMMAALGGQDPTKSLISQYLFGGMEPAVWTDSFAKAMAEIDRVGKLSAQTATQISNQKVALMLREQQLTLDTATMLGNTLVTVFQNNKAASIAQAVINTAVAITRALQLPPPFNWIQAGLIAASGAAQIATIASAQPGSASAPSVGGGGGDSGAAPAPAQTLFVEGINPNALFTGEYVRDLAERLLQYQRDGGQVVIK